jgi:hypothetical protein
MSQRTPIKMILKLKEHHKVMQLFKYKFYRGGVKKGNGSMKKEC